MSSTALDLAELILDSPDREDTPNVIYTETVPHTSYNTRGKGMKVRHTARQTEVAMSVFRSWFKAVDIKSLPAPLPRENVLLVSIGEKTVDVVFVLGGRISPGEVEVEKASSTEYEEAMPEFHKLTEFLGLGKPIPVYRGATPTKKRIAARTDLDLVIMRHKEYRMAPHLSKSDLLPYKNIIDTRVDKFWFANTELCKSAGFEKEHFRLYAEIWTCCYLHRYRRIRPNADENHRLLQQRLKQLFANTAVILKRKLRNCIPDPGTSLVHLYGYQANIDDLYSGSRDNGHPKESLIERIRDPHTPYVEMEDDFEGNEPELDLSSRAARKASATALLNRLLGELDHNKLLSVLVEKIESPFVCHDTQLQAAKMLREHQSLCQTCITAALAFQEHENGANTDSLGASQ